MKLTYLVRLTLCVFVVFGPTNTMAETPELILESDVGHVELLDKINWLVTDKQVQLSDVQDFQDWKSGALPSRLKPNQSLWGTLNIANDPSQDEPIFFTLGNPHLDYVDIYILDEKDRILSSYLLGGNRDYAKRSFKHRLFIVPIESGQPEVKVFFKISDDGPLVFSMSLDKQTSLVAREQLLLPIIGFISGGLALLAVYFLVTYIFMRSPVRFWFALSSGTFLLLFLNTKGVLGQLTGITAYISNLSCALLGVLLLSSAKVTFAILEGVPTVWRYSFYTCGFVTLAMAFYPDSSDQAIFAMFMAALSCLLITLLAFFYNKPDKKVANLVCLLGLVFIACSGFTQVAFFLSGQPTGQYLSLFFAGLIVFGIVLIALAIEAHERVLFKRHHLTQQSAISGLQHFYDLFRNSAEGLYTSSINGRLISVNPAMCSLFGYANEAEMLEQINNASQFYADPNDRKVMLGEIHKNGKVIGKEIKGVRKDNSEFWFSISGQIKQENEERYLFGSIFDISERKQSDLSLEYVATHDSLTGLYNRREFERRLQLALSHAQNQKGDLTLIYMNLDQFKVVNDTCGHKAGDLLIKQLSQKLDAVVAQKGTLARLGGDEFCVLLEGDNAQMAYLLASKLLIAVQEFRFVWENRIFIIGISIGHVPWHNNIKSPEQLLSMADSACYLAKERGPNQVHTYSPQDEHMQRYESELTWVSQINQALQDNQFELHYQHYQGLSKNTSGHYYEILLRMQGQDGRLVLPGDFLPAAERYNLTAQIDRWVVEHYFNWLADNQQHQTELTRVSINLSGHSFADKELKLFVLNAFEKHQIPYQKVCFEISESMAILKMEETLEFISTFHKLGCLFALDDFGRGFSSYGYLKNLPVDQVKIDGSFVKDILIDPIDMAMVKSIKDVAKAMGMETVAEFVESTEIMVELGKMGVDFAQGYGVAKPHALIDFKQHG
jgi:diguanylate cyclase (GGDEF)-like protein/PAS domain S-box-containing protein